MEAGPALSPAPRQPTHAHKTGYVHKPPHAGAEGPDPRQGKRREGHVPGGESRRRGRAEGGRQQTWWPAAQTVTKMGSEILKDAVAAPSTELWPGCIHLPARARLVPWGTTAIRERLRVLPPAGLGNWGRKAAAGSGRDTLERTALGWGKLKV